MRGRIQVVVGDIAREEADVIVNAANVRLEPGGGVDGAIHRAAGPGLVEELRRRYTSCAPGQAVLTGGHDLAARHIVHTVGPVWSGGDADEDKLLASCYRESLRLAAGVDARRVALPAISTGAYGFPLERAAHVTARAVVAALHEHPGIQTVRLVCFDTETSRTFGHAFDIKLKELEWERTEDAAPPRGSGAASPRWMGSD